MSLPPVVETFRETFCAQYGVPTALYDVTVLRLTLYPHARWLADLSPRAYLALDRSFIASVGALTRWHSFDGTAHDFKQAPANLRFWRHTLRLRVSVRRMRTLFSEVMGGTPAPSNQSWSQAQGRHGAGSVPTTE